MELNFFNCTLTIRIERNKEEKEKSIKLRFSEKFVKMYINDISKILFIKLLRTAHEDKYGYTPSLRSCKIFSDKYTWKSYYLPYMEK